MSRPLYREPVEARRELAERHVGAEVHVGIDRIRTGDVIERRTGVVLAVAHAFNGGSDMLVLRCAHGDLAVSLATVATITPTRAPKRVTITGGAR